MNKKQIFKYIIKEFHEMEMPKLIERELVIPKTNKTVTLIGPRRCGKTFYFYQIMTNLLKEVEKERIVYINFEDDRIFPLEIMDLDDILEAYYELYPHNKGRIIYLFFDELQNTKGWELYIRRITDKEKVKIFITGSSSKLLSKEIATSLRGRTLTFGLFPLSFSEFLKFNGVQLDGNITYSKERFNIKKLFEKYLNLGAFPEVVLEKNNLELSILNNYFEIMMYKDIVERFGIRNTPLLKVLCKFLFTNISNYFSINSYYKSLKNETPVSKETIFEYLSYLVEANIVFLLPIFSYSLKVQQANPKKAYCIDNGLRNSVSMKFSKDDGRLAENLVFIELKRRNKEIYYWKNKGEVDFVIKDANSLSAINVSYTDDVDEREIKPLFEFKNKYKNLKKLIILTKDTEQEKDGIRYIPLWKWLLEPRV